MSASSDRLVITVPSDDRHQRMLDRPRVPAWLLLGGNQVQRLLLRLARVGRT